MNFTDLAFFPVFVDRAFRPPPRSISRQALAGQKLLQEARRMTSPCDPAADVYAQRWGMLVELEAAASAVEGNDSRVLFDVPITWAEIQTAEGKKSRGSFIISARLARSHKLKFRGLLPRGGESASSWLCLRTHDLKWSAHALIVQAGILEAHWERAWIVGIVAEWIHTVVWGLLLSAADAESGAFQERRRGGEADGVAEIGMDVRYSCLEELL